MDVANELLDAIEIIVDKKIRENTAQIYLGVCKGVNGDSCVMSINGKNNTIHFYGSAPIVGLTYRVFVPNGNMSMAFAITGNDDRKGLYYSNPNLLDNWYFGNPVNQRGQASYTDLGYWIDRWYLGTDGGVCLVEDGYIRTVMSGSWFNFEQKVDNFADLKGKTVTASALVDGNIALIIGIGSNRYPFSVSHSGSKSIISLTFAVPDDSETLQFICQPQDKNGASIYAAKLELGSQQTLAHQDADGNWVLNEIPDYGEQLARCQRYFQLYSSADNRPSKAVDCRPVMRADPAQGTIVIGSTTYYYNTADL